MQLTMLDKNNSVIFLNKSKNGLVSVIIPVFKDIAGLRFTTRSLKRQSHGKKNFEIIVANDGNDNQVSKYCAVQKIICIPVLPSTGSYNARNMALRYSSGEYIAFIDAGTIADKDWLKNGLSDLKKYDYVGGAIDVVDESPSVFFSPIFIFEKNREFAVSEFMKDLHFAPTANLFIKRSVFEKLGGFNSRLMSSGDLEFGNRVHDSSTFSQFYNPNLKVYHKARSYLELVVKQNRLAEGFIDLGQIYPDRFPQYKFNLITSLIKMITPPIWLIWKRSWIDLVTSQKIVVFSLTYHFSFIQHACAIRYALFRGQ
jgi:glycosyltransferase involved in cell wall biosynthesis